MSNFLVLGLIPGTPIQITFALWMFGVFAVALGSVTYLVKRAHLIRNWLITTRIALAVREQPIGLE